MCGWIVLQCTAAECYEAAKDLKAASEIAGLCSFCCICAWQSRNKSSELHFRCSASALLYFLFTILEALYRVAFAQRCFVVGAQSVTPG